MLMRLTLKEKYGMWIFFVLLGYITWYGITNGLHRTEGFALLFPVNWLKVLFPFDSIDAAIASYRNMQWWLWVEIFITVAVWMLFFFVVRGVRIYLRNMEGISMWISAALCVLVVMLFIVLILRPIFWQMAIWWKDWPGMQPAAYPGG